MNALVGQKISIVTPKPQTTRNKILGILSKENYQAIFLDTPGLLKPKYLLQEAMVKYAYSAINEADVILFMIDATAPHVEFDSGQDVAFNALKKVKSPVYLAINKIDLVKKEVVLPVIEFYSSRYPFKEVFPISALHLTGTKELLEYLIKALPEHEPYYPPDIISEHPERFFVSEIIREKIFQKFREEIPYSTTVDVIEFREEERKKNFISAEIYVERESQKGILIGKGGAALKEIGIRARKDIEEFLGREVFLELHVKVRQGWRENQQWLNRLGYKS